MAELRDAEEQARRSEQVLIAANRLERLVLDLETGQRGFFITGQDSMLEPWRQARDTFPGQAALLERFVAGNPEQGARARRIIENATSYMRDYSVPLVSAAQEGGVRSVLTKLDLAEADDDHRRVLAVLTFLDAG